MYLCLLLECLCILLPVVRPVIGFCDDIAVVVNSGVVRSSVVGPDVYWIFLSPLSVFHILLSFVSVSFAAEATLFVVTDEAKCI